MARLGVGRGLPERFWVGCKRLDAGMSERSCKAHSCERVIARLSKWAPFGLSC
jgi:hypothetical protein